MALRNVTKALGVLFLLILVASSIYMANPRLSLEAQVGKPVPPLASTAAQKLQPAVSEIPLELRRKIDPRILKQFTDSSASRQTPTASVPARLRREDGNAVPPESTPHVRYIVHLKPKADLLKVARAAGLQDRRQAIVNALKRTAQDSQAAVLSYLSDQRAVGRVTRLTSYWIFNGLAVTSDLETLLAVAARPEVGAVRVDRVHRLPPVVKGQELSTASTSIEWNISKIGADLVWNAYGLRGEGIVVASMDSGVDWTHPALQRKYRGHDPINPMQAQHDYSWFDATGTYPTAPADGDGHGTHTMGTVVGSLSGEDDHIGVAPEARWIAAKVFDDEGEALDSWIHEGFQWILAPTDLDGRSADPSLAPDICTCSWGDSEAADTTFWDDVEALRAAGIFPVFSAGNEYLGGSVVNSPGSYPAAFTVGATTRDDAVAPWSCRGPSPWDEIKPEITAPGVDIRSALPGNRYAVWEGTSMATPHVAGVAALVWQAQQRYGTGVDGPALTITQTEQVITSTARPLPDAASAPNNDYGWGRVDAYQAVGSVAEGGAFWGRVTDVTTADGIADAMITMVNRDFGGGAHAWTDSRGYYTFSVAAGIYDVTASQFYYASQSVPKVEIIANATTQLDFQLRALPAGRVLGRVTDADTGRPISATVRNIQRSVEVSTDALGMYVVTLPLGSYVLEAVPMQVGHRIERITVTVESEGQTARRDVALRAIPRVLLVDADAWFSVGEIRYHREALDALLYTYDVWTVGERSALGVGDVPPTSTLQSYDVIVWAQPLSSPGYIGAWPALSGYLQTGGALLITGQDIGYWDVEREYGLYEYEQYLHATYIRDDATIRSVVGAGDTPFAGLVLALNAGDSAGNQDAPSAVAPVDGAAVSIFDYENDGTAGLGVTDCSGYRAVYLAFGLEGAGPHTARTEALRRALEWLAEQQPDYAFAVVPASGAATGPPGGIAEYEFSVLNLGAKADSYALEVDATRWPAMIWDASYGRPTSTTITVPRCSSAPLTLRVQVPSGAVSGQRDLLTLRVSSLGRPSVRQTRMVVVTSSMPWRSLPPLPTARYRLAVASRGCRVFAIGGWDTQGDALKLTEMYDVRTGAWQTMASRLTAAANTAAAVIDGRIYVPGGTAGETYVSVLEIYDPEANRWTRGADLPRGVTGMAVAAAGGKLYTFGGNVEGGAWLSTTYQYDPGTAVWSERTPMPSGPRTYAAAAELNGKIYIAGGWPALRTFERYDPTVDSWTSLAPMPTGRQSLSLVALDGYLYAVGGGDGWTGLPTVERYDPQTNVWLAMPPLASSTRVGLAAVSAGERIFVFGGTNAAGEVEDAHETLAIGATIGDSSLAADHAVGAGEQLSYIVTLRNPGRRTIDQAVLRDDIPAHTALVPGSLLGGADYNAAGNRVEWRGSLAPQSSREFRFRVTAAEGLPRGMVIQNAAVVDDGLCGEQIISATTVIEAPDLSVSRKVVDKTVASGGDELSYSILLRNAGAITATNVHVQDPMPPYVTYVPGSVEGGIYKPDLNQIEWSGTVPPGAQGAYSWADSDTGGVAYDWVNAMDGTSVPDGGDDRSLGPFAIGFPFEFYGTLYTQFYLDTNGRVVFGAASSAYANASIPQTGTPNNFIAPFWDDLLSEPGTMYYKLVGAAPERQLAIEWANVRRFGSSGALTFEVILYESSNRILIQYHTLNGESADGDNATVGIEDAKGEEGAEYQYNGGGPGYPLHAGLAILFQPAIGQRINFRARIAPDVPLKTLIVNHATLGSDGQQPISLLATTRVDWVDLPLSRKVVDKPLAVNGDVLSYLIELSNVEGTAATSASLVDPIPPYLTYVPGSVEGGGTYNRDLNRIEWSGTLGAAVEGGYRCTDSDTGGVAYQWINATDGTSVPGGGDDRSLGPFDIGFPFEFYGTVYTQFYVNTNGQVLFGSGSAALSNVRIPNRDTPNNFIAPFWDDLLSEPGTMYYKLVGAAPARQLAIEWANVRRFGSSGPLIFEVILYEGSNRILIQYHTLDGESADGSSASVGIEDAAGEEGVEYQHNGAGPGYPLHAGLAVLFEAAAPQQISFRAQVAADVPLNTLVVNTALLEINEQPAFPLTATTWVNHIDLSGSQLTVDRSEAYPGDRLVYSIVVRNSGNVLASNARLADPIPTSATYVPGSVEGGATYNATENRIEWRGAMPPRASVPITFAVYTSVDALHNTLVTNTATLDDGLGNLVTKTASTVLRSYDLSSSDKVMPMSALPGELLTCTLRLRNTGVLSITAVLTDTVPAGTVIVPGSAWWSSGHGTADSTTVGWQGELIAQGMVVVRFQMQSAEDLEPGITLRNTAYIADSRGHVLERSAQTVLSAMHGPLLYLPVILRRSVP